MERTMLNCLTKYWSREERVELPKIKLDHLRTLTDSIGILQHTKFSIPNRLEGYALDDNARALLAVAKYNELYNDSDIINLVETYLSFILSMQAPDGMFYNYMSHDLHLLDKRLTDALGRVLWACGYILKTGMPPGIKNSAKEIFDRSLPWSFSSTSLRTKAYAILGLYYYRIPFPSDPNILLNMSALAETLKAAYEAHSSPDWKWFEPYLTYANPRLAQALFLAYDFTRRKEFLDIAKETLDFLIEVQFIDKVFVPIGNRGWYNKGGERAIYDQQPLEAACMVEAASTALHVTGDEKYAEAASTAFEWFLGRNLKKVALYDPETGGCSDGLNPEGANLNQGAESTICYLLARLEIEEMRRIRKK